MDGLEHRERIALRVDVRGPVRRDRGPPVIRPGVELTVPSKTNGLLTVLCWKSFRHLVNQLDMEHAVVELGAGHLHVVGEAA